MDEDGEDRECEEYGGRSDGVPAGLAVTEIALTETHVDLLVAADGGGATLTQVLWRPL